MDHFEFDRILKKYCKLVLVSLREKTPRGTDIEALSQDVWKRVFLTWDQRADKNTQKEAAWIITVARNIAYDFLRSNKNKSHLPIDDELRDKNADDPLTELIDKDFRICAGNCVSRLSAPDQDLIRMRFHDGLSLKQIAEELEITVKAVEGKIARLRSELKPCISRCRCIKA